MTDKVKELNKDLAEQYKENETLRGKVVRMEDAMEGYLKQNTLDTSLKDN